MLRQSPEQGDFVRELGPQGLKVQPDGKWTYDVPVEKMPRFMGMMRGYRQADLARANSVKRSFPTVRARDRRGRAIEVPMTYEGRESVLGRKGKIQATNRMVGVVRSRVDERAFCPTCGHRWSWCECEEE